ncbi:hypothetical protein EAF00_009522 [Botryotinia globosa]|nr:hypothetical protein EAF00_009522 [Botryotinia globosa]
MSLNPSSKHKSKRGSSDDKKSSNGSEAGSVKLPTTYPEFDQLVKDLKRFDSSLKLGYHHGDTGLKARENNFRDAMQNLLKASKALADKAEEISKLTARKKRRIDKLDSLKRDCGGGKDDAEMVWKKWLKKEIEEEKKKKDQERRAEELKRGVSIRSISQEKSYKGHWSEWSHQDEYFLKKYDTIGFKLEDMLLGDNGLEARLKDLRENIKWHENPNNDLALIYRKKDLGPQEVGIIR